jgi:type I restriction enzyme R subunit
MSSVRLVYAESEFEQTTITWFEESGYEVVFGPVISPAGLEEERPSYADVVLASRLRDAVKQINPKIPAEAREEAVKKVVNVSHPSLVETNRTFHRYLTEGVPSNTGQADGSSTIPSGSWISIPPGGTTGSP